MHPTKSLRALTRYIATIFAFCLLAAACGSDTETSATTDVQQQVDAVASETETQDDQDSKSESESESAGNNVDASAFCIATEEIDNSLDSFGEGEIPTPEELEAQFNKLEASMAEVIRLAPDRIRPDVEKSAEGFRLMVQAFADADYSFFDLDLSAMDAIENDPAYDEASDAMDLFLFTDCGVGTDPRLDDDDDDDDDDGDEVEFEGTVREQIEVQLLELGLTASEAGCIVSKLDPSTFSIEDPAGIVSLFEACDISLARLAELDG